MAQPVSSVSDTEHDKNLEMYTLVWYRTDVKESNDYTDAEARLRDAINQVKIFDDADCCESYIKSSPKDEFIIFVANVQLVQEIISRMHSLSQVYLIYLYGQDDRKTNDWTTSYSKIKCVANKLNMIIDQISTDHKTRSRKHAESNLSINVFNTNNLEDKTSTELNGQFVHSQLLMDNLIRMHPKASDKNELIDLSRNFYKDNRSELNIIDEFERDYKPNRALWWYTRESFLYRLLNKALRTQAIDLLFLFRFFIRDIQKQLEQLQCSTPIRVYRGQVISNTELRNLQSSIGQFISMNSFLSTSLDRSLALSFLCSSSLTSNLQRILFEFQLDPTFSKAKPFANITSNSCFTDEQEVLIMLGSVFRLVNIRYEDKVWIAEMELCSDDDNSLKNLYDYMKKEYDENSKETSLHSFGMILFKMSQYEKAEKYFRRLLDELHPDDQNVIACYHNLGMIANQTGDYDSSLRWFNKSLEMCNKIYKANDPVFGLKYNSIGEVQFRKGNCAAALESFKKALAIRKQAFGEDHLDVAKTYHNMGNVYQGERRFQEAFECHQKALAIQLKHLPSDHSDIGSSHHCIGSIYLCLNYPDLALKCYHEALRIYRKSLPSQHHDIAMSYYNLGILYNGQGNFQQAINNYQQALSIFRATLPSTHPFVTATENAIQEISNRMK